ncbi:SOS response-associated peptidase family protein [Paenibacillus sp. GYB003]|uniref:SOS response-associated peptidase family protein n=1 Tax=Paenibacillus sp. GYB003 TaxID=2994392 RepID=UPI002F9643DB
MSYRFTLQADARSLIDRFDVTQLLAYVESDREYAPTEAVFAISGKENERILDEYRWGLLPYWAKNAVQADSRSVLNNKSFDYLLKRQRCVVPCSAYYRLEPARRRNREPQPIMLHSGDRPLAMAGVYDVRISPNGEELRACTILSVHSAAPGFEEEVPMLLADRQIDAWLSADFLSKREICDLVETIADAQPRTLVRPGAVPAPADGEGGWQPSPA